jgi:hypothetical protein
LHVYDGHQHQKERGDRAAAVNGEFAKVIAFRDQLVAPGPAQRIVHRLHRHAALQA